MKEIQGRFELARAGDFCTVIIQVGVILFKFFLSLFPAPTNKCCLKQKKGGMVALMMNVYINLFFVPCSYYPQN